MGKVFISTTTNGHSKCSFIIPIDNDRDLKKTKLKRTLKRFEKGLFGGYLGRLTSNKKAHVKLKPGAIPYKGRYYNMPKAYKNVAKKEILRMVEIGVLKELP